MSQPFSRHAMLIDGPDGAQLAATLDLPAQPAAVGLLLVTGGNETRSGAWGNQAQIAAQMAAQGYAVLRFERRGVGDSTGHNTGYAESVADLACAMAALRGAVPALDRVVALGNCDAASALMLAGGAGADGLVLSNPWTIEEESAAPSVKALREHYKKRLLNFGAVKRLLTGKVSLTGLVKSLANMAKPAPPPSTLATQLATALAGFGGPVRLLVAGNDYTGQAFLEGWDAKDSRLAICKGASHSFSEPHARVWLADQIIAALEGQHRG